MSAGGAGEAGRGGERGGAARAGHEGGAGQESRVLILGLDGATFQVLDPLFRRGLMPHLAGLAARGCRAILRSTDPYVTAPAWTSLATGKRPDTHGVFDWGVPAPGRYRRRMVNDLFRRDQAFWEILADRGIPAGTLNLPLTYPPSPRASFCVADMFTPSPDAEYTWPRVLKRELEAFGYRIDLRKSDYYQRGFEPYVADLIDMTRARGRAIRLCLERHPWRAAIAVFVGPDRLQHPFWHHLELEPGAPAGSPGHGAPAGTPGHGALAGTGERGAPAGTGDPGWSAETRRAVSYFQAVDEEIGRILALVGPETHIYVVSDHGFGPHRAAFYANDWLHAQGWLVYRPEPPAVRRARMVWHGVLRRVNERGMRWLEARDTPRAREAQAKLEQALAWLEAAVGEGLTPGAPAVDWERTVAFADTPHGIRLNLAGREPRGSVLERDYDRVREQIAAALLEVVDPRTGQPVHAEVLPREARYCGARTDLAPDLVYTFADGGSSWRIGRIDALRFGRRLPGTFLVTDTAWEHGTHRPEGILIAAGPELQAGLEAPVQHLWDLVPTMLYQLEQEIPPDLEGRVMRELFRPEVLERRIEAWGGPPAVRAGREEPGRSDGPEEREQPGRFSGPEEQAVAEHLRSLGYLA